MEPRWLSILQDRSEAPRLFRHSWKGTDGRMKLDHSDASDSRRICILGAGNLGRLFAMALAKLPDRPPITLVVHRKELLESWAARPGITMTWHGETEHNANFDVELWSDEPPTGESAQEVAAPDHIISNLIVATKAAAAMPQVDRLRRYLGPQSNVMFIQNGMNKLWAPYGKVYSDARFGEGGSPSWSHGIVTHGVTSNGPFESTLASPADVVVGTVSPRTGNGPPSDYLAGQILAAPELVGQEVCRAELWQRQLLKLVVNSVINPLTAVLRCKNGALIDNAHDDIWLVHDCLVGEASELLSRLVLHESVQEIVNDTEGDATFEKQNLIKSFDQPALWKMVNNVANKVKENTSSMLQDVLAGKETEVREFNGWFVELGASLYPNIQVDTHKALMRLVEDGEVIEPSQLKSRIEETILMLHEETSLRET